MRRDLACEGWVVHRRAGGPQHEFRYPVWMLYADVDRLAEIGSRWFSHRRRFAPLSVRAADYPRPDGSAGVGGIDEAAGWATTAGRRAAGDPADSSIRGAVNRRLRLAGQADADQLFLLTQPRSWGWLFNPVSFYFCYREGALVNVLAEITNTPWDEVHSYVLDTAEFSGGEIEVAFPKRFHVSPFLPMDIDYRWRIKLHNDDIQIAMRLFRGGEEVFFAGLYLHGDPVSERSLRRGALAQPLQSARTLLRIYWQAWRLWRKGAPFHAHPRTYEEVSQT